MFLNEYLFYLVNLFLTQQELPMTLGDLPKLKHLNVA